MPPPKFASEVFGLLLTFNLLGLAPRFVLSSIMPLVKSPYLTEGIPVITETDWRLSAGIVLKSTLPPILL